MSTIYYKFISAIFKSNFNKFFFKILTIFLILNTFIHRLLLFVYAFLW